uniref:Fe-S metabolism associated domain-containing protein n=1 Tax=Erythrolobus australicus TaxID=1077150 RepID=A0A7S1TMB9_9RHOD|mmetsp:Transcript_3839/g.10581  ORF Transcript_3839/g.10581 Transcript_3839/m.10581 type:complete len:327 (+) Transcript_3839:44-1024(+)
MGFVSSSGARVPQDARRCGKRGAWCDRTSGDVLWERRSWVLTRGRALKCGARGERSAGRRTSLSMQLPKNLAEMVRKFKLVPDPKLRYQQLLFLAKELPPMDDALKTPENKVPGCLSTVFVDVTVNENGEVALAGDSDAQLTKGLIALLIKGLSGATAEEVLALSADFIADSGLSVSLTPGRNNGFLNMLGTIKNKTREALQSSGRESSESHAAEADAIAEDVSDDVVDPSRPVYSAIVRKLQVLKPTVLEIRDDSASHAGHAGAKGLNGESHFAIRVVSSMFSELSVVKRHQLIYALLEDEMRDSIHALQIKALTVDEHDKVKAL